MEEECINYKEQISDNYIAIMLNDFLFNAGVLGLIKMFEYANSRQEYICVENKDYIIEGQILKISKEFLKTTNIAQLYIDSLVYYLKDDTKFIRIMNQKNILDSLYNSPEFESKDWNKKVNGLFKEFSDMLLKSSFKTGYDILKSSNDIIIPDANDIKEFSKIHDLKIKKEKYDEIHKIISQDSVQKILIFKDLLYTKINMFYADNKGNGAAFFCNSNIDPAIAFHKRFVQPLLETFADGESKTSANDIMCINCGCQTTKKYASPISIFVDQADDLNRKKSYYWNCNPDAYLCPICAFICSLSPLGFSYLGQDGIFVNNNLSIKLLQNFDAVITEKFKSGDLSYYTLYNMFAFEEIKTLKNTVNNIQVIIRDKNTDKYRMKIINKKIVEVLESSSKQLEYINKKFVKEGESFINVYLQTVNNILNGRNQYILITKLMKIALNNSENTNYLYSILQIQINQKGGINMTDNTKRAYSAKMRGQELRKILTKDTPLEADKENKLRGLVYQMLNAVSVSNKDKFLEIVIRTYSSCNNAVPDIFFSCFGSDEEFKEIGFAFLLGLKAMENRKEETV